MQLKLMKVMGEVPSTFWFSKERSNCRVWNFKIPGAKRSAWEGYELSGKLVFPPNYPKGSIAIYLKPAIFHPNIDPFDGLVCDASISAQGLDRLSSRKSLTNNSTDVPTRNSTMP